MNLIILAATDRGLRCIRNLSKVLTKDDQLTIFTFPEMEWEPKYVSNIQQLAAEIGAECNVTTKVHSEKFNHIWKNDIDIIFVIGWRYLIPELVYKEVKIGCFVFHDSLLPEYRGFGPTVWAIRNGEKYTGASLFKISHSVDDGPLLDQRKVEIGDKEYICEIMEKVTVCYEEMIKENYLRLIEGRMELTNQVSESATYTCKNIPDDFEINWSQSANDIYNLIRSYSSPYPGAFTFLGGKKITILRASIAEIPNYIGLIPGRVILFEDSGSVTILCGSGAIRIEEIRFEGKVISNIKSVIKSIGNTLGI